MLARHCLAIAALTGCATDPTFPADVYGLSTDPTLRLAAHVHQREVDGAPATTIEVWVARDAGGTTTPPPPETAVRDAVVRAGDDVVVDAVPVEDERGLRYVATLERWLEDVQVRAHVGDATIEITRTPLISDPVEMDARLPEVAIVGGTHALTWDVQGRPVLPMLVVTTAEQPIQFTLLHGLSTVETGHIDLPATTFPRAGVYAVNLVRTVDYASPDVGVADVALSASSYWHRTIAAVPRMPK